MTDPFALKVAAFVATALELDADPAAIAEEVVSLKRDPNAGISTVELQSAAGPAPFLVYHYLLAETNDEGESGQELFDADVATLQRATEQNTPGPRILAHATAEGEAYVLATTPEVFRTLTGASEPQEEPPEPPIVSPQAAVATRKHAADRLIRLLRQANNEAANWLRATRNGEQATELGPEEAALALYLIDNESIKSLLQAINLLIESAQEQAVRAMTREEPPSQPV